MERDVCGGVRRPNTGWCGVGSSAKGRDGPNCAVSAGRANATRAARCERRKECATRDHQELQLTAGPRRESPRFGKNTVTYLAGGDGVRLCGVAGNALVEMVGGISRLGGANFNKA